MLWSIDSLDQSDTIVRELTKLIPPNEFQSITLQYDYGLQDLVPFIHQLMYHVRISISTMSNAFLPVENVLDWGAGMDLVRKTFLRNECKTSSNPIKMPLFLAASS